MMPSSARVAPPVIAALLAALLAGCGACQKVSSSRQSFLEAQQGDPADGRPHLSIEIPDALLKGWLDRAVAALPGVNFQVPGLGDVAKYAGNFTFDARSLRVAVDRDDAARFDLDLDVKRGDSTLFGMQLAAAAPIQFDPKKRTMRIALRADLFEKVQPRIDDDAVRKLTDALYGQVPSAARLVLKRSTVERYARQGIEALARETYGLVRRQLLTPLGELASFTVQLPDVPLAGIGLAAAKGGWRLDARTTLASRGLAPASQVGVRGDMVRVAISADTVAHLGNWAIARGALPGRYTKDGKAAANGEFEAGFAWDAGQRPLKALMWTHQAQSKQDGLCVHARAGAEPVVSLDRGKLKVGFENGQIEEVVGPPLLSVALDIMGVTEKVFDFTKTVATGTELKLGRGSYSVELSQVGLRQNVFSLDLKVGSGRPGS